MWVNTVDHRVGAQQLRECLAPLIVPGIWDGIVVVIGHRTRYNLVVSVDVQEFSMLRQVVIELIRLVFGEREGNEGQIILIIDGKIVQHSRCFLVLPRDVDADDGCFEHVFSRRPDLDNTFFRSNGNVQLVVVDGFGLLI